jgi:hypothetical protein
MEVVGYLQGLVFNLRGKLLIQGKITLCQIAELDWKESRKQFKVKLAFFLVNSI